MTRTRHIAVVGAAVVASIALASPAAADVDTDFAVQLHTYGIYGQRDFNAYLAKIACHRLGTALDANADESVTFLSHNLPRGTTAPQTYQFLGTAISFYCPELTPVWENAAAQGH